MRCASSNEDGVVTAPSSGRSSMMWRNPAAMLKPSSSSPGPKSSVATSTSQRKTVPLKSACLAFSPSELLRLSRTLLPSTSCANPATSVRRGPPGCLRRLSPSRCQLVGNCQPATIARWAWLSGLALLLLPMCSRSTTCQATARPVTVAGGLHSFRWRQRHADCPADRHRGSPVASFSLRRGGEELAATADRRSHRSAPGGHAGNVYPAGELYSVVP